MIQVIIMEITTTIKMETPDQQLLGIHMTDLAQVDSKISEPPVLAS